MKNILFAILIAMTAMPAVAQTQDKNLISVQGEGEIMALPDEVVLYPGVSAKNQSYNAVVDELNKRAAELQKVLIKAGFKESEIKTTAYSINKNITWENGKQRDEGYIGHHNFKVQFPFDQKRLQNVMEKLAASPVPVQFNFAFTISDTKMKELEKEMLKNAVADAKRKAAVLTEAAGVSLGKIYRIDQRPSQGYQPIYSRAMEMDESAAKQGPVEINANEIRLQRNVEISWVID